MKTPISKIVWTPESIKAWRKSVAHWRRMATGKAKLTETPGGKSCSLCSVFFDMHSYTCGKCPVKQATGNNNCVGSPWGRANDAYWSYGIDSQQFRAADRKELAFLESLRPAKKRGGK